MDEQSSKNRVPVETLGICDICRTPVTNIDPDNIVVIDGNPTHKDCHEQRILEQHLSFVPMSDELN